MGRVKRMREEEVTAILGGAVDVEMLDVWDMAELVYPDGFTPQVAWLLRMAWASGVEAQKKDRATWTRVQDAMQRAEDDL